MRFAKTGRAPARPWPRQRRQLNIPLLDAVVTAGVVSGGCSGVAMISFKPAASSASWKHEQGIVADAVVVVKSGPSLTVTTAFVPVELSA